MTEGVFPMKRMKRLSYLLVFALLMTTLFSGTSVFAGGPEANVDVTPSVALYNQSTVRVTWSFNSNFVSGTHMNRYNVTDNVTEDVGTVSSDYSYSRFDDSTIVEGKTYRYQIVNGDKVSNWSADIAIPKKEESGGSGGGGGGGEGDPAPGKTDIKAPAVKTVTVDQSYTLMGKANISGTISYANYKEDGSIQYCYDTKVELLDGTKVLKAASLKSQSFFMFNNISVPYGTYKSYKIKVTANIDGKDYSSTKNTKKVRSKQMKKNTGVRATKISAKQAVVRWSSVDGATSYRIYKGKKKVKEVKSSVLKTTIKGKGAGSAKYKVVPVRKADGKKYAGKSATAKPKANVYITSNTGKVNSWTVKATFAVKKVSLSGKTYTVTGWGKNYAMYIKLKKFKSIKITVYCDGKIVAKKTIKNKRMNLNPQRSKKMTFKIKGKAGADLRHGFTNVSVRCTCDPVTLNP